MLVSGCTRDSAGLECSLPTGIDPEIPEEVKMDFEFTISGQQWIGIAIGAVLYMVLSFIWYMPRVFGNAWMEAEGLTEDDLQGAGTPVIYVITLVMAVVSNIVIALVLSNVGGGFGNGLAVGLMLGLGIAAMAIAPHYMFANKSRLVWIQAGHATVLITVSGIVIGLLT